MDGFAACFEDLDDPRTGNAERHDLVEILMIALRTVLCGGENAVDPGFRRGRLWPSSPAPRKNCCGVLKLKNGLPSHDTFSRVFRLLDPEQFRACFQRFMARFGEACGGVIAIKPAPAKAGGKVLRRSFDSASATSPLHMVSAGEASFALAWSCDQRLVLAQIATDAKSNEITAVPKLLAMLSLKGAIVTVDALNCQREIARQIVDRGGDYALALKGNQGTLHADVSTFLDDPQRQATPIHVTVDGDHGRIETRTSTLDIGWLQEDHQWPGLAAIGKVARIRETATKTTTETAYYLLSAAFSAERFGEVVRCHWGVENRLHWVLDVIMNEDQARNRLDNGPKNLAVLRHIALNLMRKENSKGSLRGKFKRAGWRDDYLAKLIAQI